MKTKKHVQRASIECNHLKEFREPITSQLLSRSLHVLLYNKHKRIQTIIAAYKWHKPTLGIYYLCRCWNFDHIITTAVNYNLVEMDEYMKSITSSFTAASQFKL